MSRDRLLPRAFPTPADPSLAGWWPLFGLRIETDELVLRPVTDEDLPAVLAALQHGIHPTGQNPFGPVAWSQAPPEDVARQTLQHIWRSRAATGPDTWEIQCGVWDRSAAGSADPASSAPPRDTDGELIGLQSLGAETFRLTRTVTTGSWLRHGTQGRGLGRLARAMALTLAFDHFGALAAETTSAVWNEASLGVSRALGYRDNGVHVRAWGRQAEAEIHLRVTPDDFRRPAQPVSVTGIEPVRQFLAIPTSVPSPTEEYAP